MMMMMMMKNKGAGVNCNDFRSHEFKKKLASKKINKSRKKHGRKRK